VLFNLIQIDHLSVTLALTSLFAWFVFHLFLKPWKPDLPPYKLNHQSSVSKTRKQGESAIYRSLDTPIGTKLWSTHPKFPQIVTLYGNNIQYHLPYFSVSFFLFFFFFNFY